VEQNRGVDDQALAGLDLSELIGRLPNQATWSNRLSVNTATTNCEADIWLRTMLPDESEVVPAEAGRILKLRLSARDLARAEELGDKANVGALTPMEADELHYYLTVGRTLELMQARARLALKRAGLPT